MSVASTEYWSELSKSKLTDDEVKLFEEQLDWDIVSYCGNISHDMWLIYCGRICKDTIIYNRTVSVATFNALKEHVNWSKLEEERPIDDDFLLNICDYFYSANFANKNESAKIIRNETWDMIMKRNGEELDKLSSLDREYCIGTQIVSLASLSAYKKEWRIDEWESISKLQRLDVTFIKENWRHLNTRFIQDQNKAHNLTQADFDEIAAFISNELREGIKKGGYYDWRKLAVQYRLTEDFKKDYFPKSDVLIEDDVDEAFDEEWDEK